MYHTKSEKKRVDIEHAKQGKNTGVKNGRFQQERERICNYLECFGIKLDKEKNKIRGEESEISADDSKVKIYIVPTNEEILIARDTYELTK